MKEQQATTQSGEPNGNPDGDAPVGPTRPVFSNGWYFNRGLHEYADRRKIGEWWAFCVIGEIVRGKGVPDLVAYRKNPDTGVYEVLAAELKREEESEWREGQKEWLEAFAAMGITTQVWYSDNRKDRDKLYDILENGTAGYTSVTEAPPRKTEDTNRLYSWEGFFNNEVNDTAMHRGWRIFHADGFNVVRGKDFPHWTMFRQNAETGKYEMLVAALKQYTNEEFRGGQEEWLEAFKGMGITTKVWRGNSLDDLSELYDVMEKGTAGHDSVTKLPPRVISQIPANFGVIMANTIEYIEGNEMTTGEKSSLRRMDPANPGSSVFWKLMAQRGMDGVNVGKWGLITHGIASMSHGTGVAHSPRRPVGQVLYEGNGDGAARGFYSEDRLATLLSARGETLYRLLARLFRMLANEGCSFNWWEMAWLILNEGYNEAEADKSRIEIARAYYRAEQRSNRQSEG